VLVFGGYQQLVASGDDGAALGHEALRAAPDQHDQHSLREGEVDQLAADRMGARLDEDLVQLGTLVAGVTATSRWPTGRRAVR
jgi:hypothetical protein